MTKVGGSKIPNPSPFFRTPPNDIIKVGQDIDVYEVATLAI